jgi:hypothetical protein
VFEAQQAAIENAFRETPELQGPFRDFLLRIASPEVSALTLAFTFFVSLMFYAMFAMIGGIVTVAVMTRRQLKQDSALREIRNPGLRFNPNPT